MPSWRCAPAWPPPKFSTGLRGRARRPSRGTRTRRYNLVGPTRKGDANVRWTDDLQIETPEQIDVSLELAGLGSRFIARLTDWLVEIGILAVAGLLGVILLTLLGITVGATMGSVFVAPFLIALALVFLLSYDVYFEV